MSKRHKLHLFGKADHNVTIYLAIAQLIIHYATNESMSMRSLHTLLGATMKDATAVFHSHRNTQGRLDLVMALGNGKITDEDLKSDLSKLVTEFRGLSRTRNFFAHAMYRYDDELC